VTLREKLILVDVDGVLLDWQYAFDRWAESHGYKRLHNSEYDLESQYGIEREEVDKLVRMFNESAHIAYLPPFRDAIKYVRKIHEEFGMVFYAITSVSSDPFVARLREDNLRRVFGETAFEKVVCLDTNACKKTSLVKFRESACLWIDDKPKNVYDGIMYGLDGLLMNHEYNRGVEGIGEKRRVNNWKEIYKIVERNVGWKE